MSKPGFAQALSSAGFSEPGPLIPAATTSNGAQVPVASQRNAKVGIRQQSSASGTGLASTVTTIQPAASALTANGQVAAMPAAPALLHPAPATLQGSSAGDMAATIQTSVPATSALPYWIRSFSRFSKGQGQPAKPAIKEASPFSQGQAPLTEPSLQDSGWHGPAWQITVEAKYQAAETGQLAAALAAKTDSSPAADQPPTGGSAPAPTSPQTPASPPVPSAPQQANAVDIAVATATPLLAVSASPSWISPFPRVADSEGQASRRQSSLKDSSTYEPAAPLSKEAALPVGVFVAGQAASADAKGQREMAESGTGLAAGAGSQPETSKLQTQQNPQPAPTGEMAFAARVQPVQTASATAPVSPQPAQNNIAAPPQAFSKKTAESGAAATVVAPITAGAGASLASYGQASENQPGASLPEAEPSNSAPPSPVDVPQTLPKPASTPVNDISLQVTQPGAQKVEVRVVQQAGELRVAVHTGDSDLAHGLQQGLSDLVGRLQETGFRAEAWHPGGTSVQSTPVIEPRTGTGGSQNGDSQGHYGGSRQQEGERRQNGSARPGWVEELDGSIASSEQSQGASYGIGS